MRGIIIKSVGTSVKRTVVLGTAFILHSQGTGAFSNEDAVYAYVKYCAASLRTQLERRRRRATLKNRRPCILMYTRKQEVMQPLTLWCLSSYTLSNSTGIYRVTLKCVSTTANARCTQNIQILFSTAWTIATSRYCNIRLSISGVFE